jgi:hypothetical protein
MSPVARGEPAVLADVDLTVGTFAGSAIGTLLVLGGDLESQVMRVTTRSRARLWRPMPQWP